MKIKQIKINLVRLPLEEPLVGAPPFPAMQRDFITVQILTDDGIEGIGVTGFCRQDRAHRQNRAWRSLAP